MYKSVCKKYLCKEFVQQFLINNVLTREDVWSLYTDGNWFILIFYHLCVRCSSRGRRKRSDAEEREESWKRGRWVVECGAERWNMGDGQKGDAFEDNSADGSDRGGESETEGEDSEGNSALSYNLNLYYGRRNPQFAFVGPLLSPCDRVCCFPCVNQDKLQREEKNSAKNLLKINEGWMKILEQTQSVKQKEEISVMRATFEREMEELDSIIEVNFFYSTLFTS